MQLSRAGFLCILVTLQGRALAVSSQKADEAVPARAGASPWLSLLTSSWALAGEPESQQTQGLDDLAKNIVKLAHDGTSAPDESMKEAIASIRSIVKDMAKSVNDTNAAAQYEIDRKAEAVAACKVPQAPTTKLPTPDEPNTCRDEEGPLQVAWKHCESEKARCSNTTECCAPLVQPNAYCINAGSAPSPLQYESQCEGTSACKDTDIKEKIAFFKGKLDELDKAEQACEDSRKGCQDSYDCQPKLDAWKAKQTECNQKQTDFEQHYCKLAESLEASWDTYFTCYDTKKTALTSEEVKQEGVEPGRQQEWRALLRIDCLLGALEADNVTSALTKCINTNYTKDDWKHLHLRYPTRLDNFTAKASCSEKLWAPGTEHFRHSMYPKAGELYPSSLNTYFCVSGLGSSHCPVNSGATMFIARAAVATKAAELGLAPHTASPAPNKNMARLPHAHHHKHHR